MHEMQCVENVMSPGPRGPHTKSDDKWMDTSNKQVWCVCTKPKSNIKQNEKKNEIRWSRVKWMDKIKMEEGEEIEKVSDGQPASKRGK